MNIHSILKIYILIIISLIVSSQFAIAGDIKNRMKQRLPAIAALKTKGIIGENNRGYLGFVTSTIAQKSMIVAENQDRKMVYTYFAKKQNTTLTVVETVQAERKAQKTGKGKFYQNSGGVWVQK